MGIAKRLGAVMVAGTVSVVGLVGIAATPAAAAPLTVKFTCNVPLFTKTFTWDAEVTPTFTGSGATQKIVLQMSNMPGLAPVPITNGAVEGTTKLTVNGTAVVATGSGTTSAAPNGPIPLMPMSGDYAGAIADPVIVVSQADFVVTASGVVVDVNCLAGSDPVFPTPTPTPTPTSTATPTPTPTPTKATDEPAKKGVPAKGTAKFACKLQTLGSPFNYNPTVSMAGSRAKAGDSKVTLKVNFSDIPGLAPLPIENGTMKVNASAMVGGKKVSFAESSTVNAPTYGEVPVPTMTATITTDEDELPVEITAFKFDFGEMAGLNVYSECSGGGKLSAMTVGVGATDDDDDDTSSGGSASSGGTLPKTGAGAPLLMMGLWSSAFVLLAVALLLFLPRRTRER